MVQTKVCTISITTRLELASQPIFDYIKDMKSDTKTHFDLLVSAYKQIIFTLADMGYDIDNENFRQTPQRCARAMLEDFILPPAKIDDLLEELLSKTFPAEFDEMVVETNIPVVALCPHHLLPVEMRVFVGYIPDKQVLGLSKLARIAKLLGKQPILQEDYTQELAKAINELKPAGVGVHVIGKHGCMRFRGVNVPQSDTITSCLIGKFKEQPATREEFLRFCER